MFTDNKKSFGKLKLLLDSNREYYSYFQQAKAESKDYICEEQTETSLGQHLLDFLESSRTVFSEVTEQYHKIDDYLTKDHMNFEKILGYMLFIQKLYQRLADTNIIWRSVVFNSALFSHYRWYRFYATKEYLLDSAPIQEEVRLEKMKIYWEQTRKAIMEEIILFDTITSFITSLGNAITFCLDNSAFPELEDMHPIKRSYLYQTLFDNSFLSDDSMKIFLQLTEKDFMIPGMEVSISSHSITPKEQLYLSTFSSKNYFNLFQNADSRRAFSQYVKNVKQQDIELGLTLEVRTIEDVYTTCLYSFFTLVSKNIHVRRCRHCGLYFSPYNRSDEVYCSRQWENGKSCRDSYHEKKMQSDELAKYYRSAYKTRNARKQRNLKNKPSAEKEFHDWVTVAKRALEQAKNNEISFDEFKRILDSAYSG